MNPHPLGNRPCFVNGTLYKMKALQKIKNNLVETLANYISQNANKNDTISALTDIRNKTCKVIITDNNEKISPIITIPNNQCNC